MYLIWQIKQQREWYCILGTSTSRPKLCIASTTDLLSSPLWSKPLATHNSTSQEIKQEQTLLTPWQYGMYYIYFIFGDMHVL